MFNFSLLWRLYAGFVAVTALLAVVLSFQIGKQVEKNSLMEFEESLKVRSELLAKQFENGFAAFPEESLQKDIEALGTQTKMRITLVMPDGRVAADSDERPELMNNHDGRSEVIQAKQEGVGKSLRFSETLNQKMLYWAQGIPDVRKLEGKPPENISVVRVAFSLDEIETKVTSLQEKIYLWAGVSMLLSLLLGFYLSKRFSGPIQDITSVAEVIAKGDYSQRIESGYRGEMGKLATAFNKMASGAEKRVAELTADKNKIATILSGMVEGVLAVDPEQNILHINETAARLLNVSATNSVSKPVNDVVKSADIHQVLQGIIHSDEVQRTEIIISRGGQETFVEVYGASIDVGGRSKGAVLVLHDVSELHRLERIRRDFVANASHELKTPITAIRGIIETVLDDPNMEEEVQRDFLGKTHAQTERLVNIVSDLMALSRLEAGEKADELVTLNAIISQSVKSFQSVATGEKISLQHSQPEENIKVVGDSQALGQLFDNLIDNGIKYNVSGGYVSIDLSKQNGSAIIRVEDNGKGIKSKDLPRIFERFYRVDKGRSRELGGTGLGLSIVRHIVEQHGGTIDVKSEFGEGTVFTIAIPVS